MELCRLLVLHNTYSQFILHAKHSMIPALYSGLGGLFLIAGDGRGKEGVKCDHGEWEG